MSAVAPRNVGVIRGGDGSSPAAFSWAWIGLVVAVGVVELALLAVWQRNGYWDFSDGVYALSGREFLHRLVPYRDFAAAQPPLVYLAGLLLLAVHNGLASVRAGMALLDFVTAALVGVCVWRLARNRWLALAAALVTPLLPISLQQHAQLTPETLAAPLLLAGAILCARPRLAWIGGALLAVAAFSKLAFLIPAVAIALASPGRRKALLSVLAIGVLLTAASLELFGTSVWRQAVDAQLQVGRASWHYAGGLVAQAAWSELPLVILAAAAVLFSRGDSGAVPDRSLFRTLVASAAAGLVLTLTVLKRGSYINVLVVAEPPLLALAACGAQLCWRRTRGWRSLPIVLGALLAAQSASLLVSPGNAVVARRPGAASGPAWTASPETVHREIAQAHRCPRGTAYSGDPYLAFLADRRMPGNQPDIFIIEDSREDARFAQKAVADEPRCPRP